MKKPQGYDMSKYAAMGYPKEWLEYFMSNDKEEDTEETKSENTTIKSSNFKQNNLTEEQIEDPNFWINL